MIKKVLLGTMCLGIVAGLAAYQVKKKSDCQKETDVNTDEEIKVMFGLTDGKEIGTDYGNALIIGVSGSGKSYNYMWSNLLNSQSSAIVYDPHRELNTVTLRGQGYKVFYVNGDSSDCDVIEICDVLRKEKAVAVLRFTHDKSACEWIEKAFVHLVSEDISAFSQHITFWLDGISRLKELTALDEKFVKARKHDLDFQVIAGSFRELQDSRPDEFPSVLANCASFLCTGGLAGTEAEQLRKWYHIPDEMICKQADFKKNIAVFRGHAPRLCDKLNPDNYKK